MQLGSEFEFHGYHRLVSRSRSHELGPALAIGSQEKSHHENKAGDYGPRRIGTHGKRRRCTTTGKQSYAHSASFSHIRAGLWVRPAGSATISIIGRRLRIVFAREAILSKPRPRAVPGTCRGRIFVVKVITLIHATRHEPGKTPGLISVGHATF